MLTIITIGYRYQNFWTVYQSIPKEADIRWLIGISKTRPLGIRSAMFNDDPRVKVLEADCEEERDAAHAKLTVCFNEIKSGQFIILDDDTQFHPNMLNVYRRYQDFEGIIVGEQLYGNEVRRLPAKTPRVGEVDTGSCICHHSALKYVTWRSTRVVECPDGAFWMDCVLALGSDKVILVHEPISYYNKLTGLYTG